MTNAIEQTKREMYKALAALKDGGRWLMKKGNAEAFESALEAHLETWRVELKKFVDKNTCAIGVGDGSGGLFVHGDFASVKAVQAIIIAGEDVRKRLANMTQERDDIQGRLHAIDHAYNEQSNRIAIMGKMIDNLRTASAAAGEELIRVQGIARQHLDDCRSAEKLSDDLDEKLRDAQAVIGQQEQLIAGQRHAIAELYMERASIPSGVMAYAKKLAAHAWEMSQRKHVHDFEPAFPAGEMCQCGAIRDPGFKG